VIDGGSETVIFLPGDLVFFIDETGHEKFADPQFPVFGFGGIAVTADKLDNDVRSPWQELRRAIRGSETAPLHASDLTQAEIEQHAPAIGEFFRDGRFARLGVSCSDHTASPNSITVNEYILGALKNRITAIMEHTTARSLRIIFEKTERLGSSIERYFGDLRLVENDIAIPIHFYFLPKSSNDPALEVADFVAHSVGRHAHPKRREENSYGLDFQSIFHDQDRRRVSYIHIQKVNVSDPIDSNIMS
jgi:hypothetical protein